MSETPNLDKLKDMVVRFKNLLDAGEVGLISWRMMYAEQAKEILDFLGCCNCPALAAKDAEIEVLKHAAHLWAVEIEKLENEIFEHRVIVNALSAKLSRCAAGEWLPIADAPIGKRILIGRPATDGGWFWMDGKFDTEENGARFGGGCGYTHYAEIRPAKEGK